MHALVLFDKAGEGDLLGIWGPYASSTAAESAKNELVNWPIDGAWEVMEMKEYPGPQQPYLPFQTMPGVRDQYPMPGTITCSGAGLRTTNTTNTTNASPEVRDFYGGFHGEASDG